MGCNVGDLDGMDDRDLDAVFLKAIRRDDGAAARSHLEAGRAIYYCDDEIPVGMIREWPDGRKELIHVMNDGRVTVLRQFS